MASDHDILEVLGVDRSALKSLSRWQLAALALEVLDAIYDTEAPLQERRLLAEARGAAAELRSYYD